MKSSLFSNIIHSPLISNVMRSPLISNHAPNIKGSLFVGIAIVIASMIFSWSFYQSRQEPRYVSVKGLSEREVTADIAIWPINFVLTGTELNALQRQLSEQQSKIINFLKKQGFQETDISYGIPNIEDNEAKNYGEAGNKRFRYTAHNNIILRSQNVYAVEQALQQSDQLLAQGITLVAPWNAEPKFIFTKLNEIKPAMIQEANKSAREAAEQFAQDASNQIQGIRNATQGLFHIQDTHLPTRKQVRVVTTVQYLLKHK